MKFQFIFTLLCFVSVVISETTFIEKGNRAQLFELLDNKVVAFKLTLPEDEFSVMKKRAIINNDIASVAIELSVMNDVIREVLENLKNYQYPKTLIDNYVDEQLPSWEVLSALKINEAGLSNFDVDSVLQGFNFNTEDYDVEMFKQDPQNIAFLLLKSQQDFKLIEIVKILDQLQIPYDTNISSSVLSILNSLKESDTPDEGFFTKIFEIYDNYDDNFSYLPQFKTKNASLSVDLNGKTNYFKKVTISLGGNFSRYFSKPGINLKIRGDKNLFGRSQFKLRADCNDPSFLRTKIVSDIHNRLGIPSVSSSPIELYINEEYMGLYLLNDAYKLSWIKNQYGEEETQNLYKCTNMYDFSSFYPEGCINDNDDVIDTYDDNSEWMKFLKAVDKANSAADLEDVFEIDHFLTEMAIDYLVGSWDHMQEGHNYYMYKQPNGKWIYLSQDFDHDLGQDPCEIEVPYTKYFTSNHILHLLVLTNQSRFEKILDDIVQKVFNPFVLFPHLEELRDILKPYIIKDRTPDENGNYPGRINFNEKDLYTLGQWYSNIDYLSFENSAHGKIYGLKQWISQKYSYVCNQYDLAGCDIDDSNSISTNNAVQTSTNNIDPTSTNNIDPTSTNNTDPTSTNNIDPTSTNNTITKTVTVITSNASATVTSSSIDDNCWSKSLGYSCCNHCKVVLTDKDGEWGVEDHHWCGIPENCPKNE